MVPKQNGAAGLNAGAGNECALLARACAGDSAAFDALYRAHYDLLWRFAYRHVRQAETAEDVVHDVFAALWNQRQAVVVRTTVIAYLMGAVHKRAIDAIRRRDVMERTAAAGNAVAVGAAALPPDAWVEVRAARAAVSHAVAGLPPRQRLAIVLHWREQLRYVEAAEVLSVTEAAVRRLVGKAHVALGRSLRGWHGDGERQPGQSTAAGAEFPALPAVVAPPKRATETG